jgi:hypothetical protein
MMKMPGFGDRASCPHRLDVALSGIVLRATIVAYDLKSLKAFNSFIVDS